MGEVAFLVLETYRVEARGTSPESLQAAQLFRDTLEIRASLTGALVPLGETLAMFRKAGWEITETGESMNPPGAIY